VDRLAEGPDERRWYQRCAFCSYEDLEHHPGCTWAKYLRAALRHGNGVVVVLAGRDAERHGALVQPGTLADRPT